MANDSDHHNHHGDHSEVPSEQALRVKALETLLVDKGLVDPAAVDAFVDFFQDEIGPKNGAKVVARAWVDPAFKAALLDDATSTLANMGFAGLQGENMVAVENTDTVHNMVVCTLCSCYPWPVLGIPPTWYKSFEYRSRAVIEPRGVLKEFGVELTDDVTVRVWDSTAEIRYLVIPKRPAGSDNLSEDQLAELVTRDSMIGTDVLAAA
jgi:nitrile hydratase